MRSFIKAITLVAATIAVFAVWAPSPAQAQINSIFFDKRTAHNNAFKASGFNPLKELAEGPYPNANAIADSVEKRAVVGSCEPGWHVCTAAGGYCCSNDTLCSPVSRLCCSSQASYICGGSNCCPFNRCYADGSCGCDIGKTKCGTNCCTFGCDNTGNFCKCPDENPVDCGMYCCSIGYSCGAGNTCSAGTTLVIPSGPRTSSILVPRTSSRYGETGAGSISMSNLYLPGTEPTGVPLSTLPTPPPPSTNNAGAIGGGVAGGVVVIGIIGFIFIRRRKQQNLQATPTDVDMPNSIGGINGGKIEVESAPGSSPPRTSTPYTRPEHKEGAEQQHYQQQYPASQEYQVNYGIQGSAFIPPQPQQQQQFQGSQSYSSGASYNSNAPSWSPTSPIIPARPQQTGYPGQNSSQSQRHSMYQQQPKERQPGNPQLYESDRASFQWQQDAPRSRAPQDRT